MVTVRRLRSAVCTVTWMAWRDFSGWRGFSTLRGFGGSAPLGGSAAAPGASAWASASPALCEGSAVTDIGASPDSTKAGRAGAGAASIGPASRCSNVATGVGGSASRSAKVATGGWVSTGVDVAAGAGGGAAADTAGADASTGLACTSTSTGATGFTGTIGPTCATRTRFSTLAERGSAGAAWGLINYLVGNFIFGSARRGPGGATPIGHRPGLIAARHRQVRRAHAIEHRLRFLQRLRDRQQAAKPEHHSDAKHSPQRTHHRWHDTPSHARAREHVCSQAGSTRSAVPRHR